MKTIDTNTASLSQLIAFYNANVTADNRLKKFRDRATAIRRVQELIDSNRYAAELAHERARDTRMRKIRARVITRVTPVEETNKRCLARERYALYRVGMTVAEYLAAGGKLRDVAYDIRAGFISVEEGDRSEVATEDLTFGKE